MHVLNARWKVKTSVKYWKHSYSNKTNVEWLVQICQIHMLKHSWLWGSSELNLIYDIIALCQTTNSKLLRKNRLRNDELSHLQSLRTITWQLIRKKFWKQATEDFSHRTVQWIGSVQTVHLRLTASVLKQLSVKSIKRSTVLATWQQQAPLKK